MSRIETLRNDAAKLLTALYAESTLSNAVALANVANQMIAELSSASILKQREIPAGAPAFLREYSEETKTNWANGEWHTVICGLDYAKSTANFQSLIHDLAKQRGKCATTAVHGDSVRFRMFDKEAK